MPEERRDYAMTEKALKQFGKGEAFIDMQGTTERDWINLIEQCARVGIDLNERAMTHLAAYSATELGGIQPFVFYLRIHIHGYKYLKCTDTDKLTTWNKNVLGLPIYNYTPEENIPVFEV